MKHPDPEQSRPLEFEADEWLRDFEVGTRVVVAVRTSAVLGHYSIPRAEKQLETLNALIH